MGIGEFYELERWGYIIERPIAQRDRSAPLMLDPHYSDTRWREAQTVFGEEEKGLNYDYSDRLWGWDYAKAKEAFELANASGLAPKSAAWVEHAWAHFQGVPLEVRHVMAGVNLSSGYPYYVVGWRKA